MGSEDYRSPWQKKREAERREEVDNLKPAERLEAASNSESVEPVTRWPRSNASSPHTVARGKRNISIYFAVILAVAVMTVVLVYLRGESKARVASGFQQKVRAESLATTSEISKYSEQCVESVERFARNLAEAQTRDTALEFAKIATKDEKRKEARRDLQPDVTAVRFAFLHDAFDGNDAKFANRDGYGGSGRMLAAFVLRGLEWQREANSDKEGNLPDEPWYRDVMSTRTKHFSYARSKAGFPLFSWSAPILRNGRFVGVACIEYSHGAMRHILLEYAPGVDRKRAPMFTWAPPGPFISTLDGTVVLSLEDYRNGKRYTERIGDPNNIHPVISTALEKIRQGADSYAFVGRVSRGGESLVDFVRFDMGEGEPWVLISESDLTKVYIEDGDMYSTILVLMYVVLLGAGVFLWARRQKANTALSDSEEQR